MSLWKHFPLVRAANQKGYLVIIITNQAGIGRGYYTEEDFFALMHWMQEQFQKHGTVVHDVFYCLSIPFMESAVTGGRVSCANRIRA